MVAWSTILMPIEGALITQFMGFVALYYVLTFIVGASIVLTLIGRGELPDHIPGSTDRVKVFSVGSEEELAKVEEARVEKKKKKAGTDERAGKEKEDKTR
jgi:hypothetical protein